MNEKHLLCYYNEQFSDDVSNRHEPSAIYLYCVIRKDKNGIQTLLELKELLINFFVMKGQSAQYLSTEVQNSITNIQLIVFTSTVPLAI